MHVKLTLFFLAALMLLTSCSPASGSQSATPTPLPTPVLPTFTVQQGTLSQEATLAGRIQPLLVREVAFEIDGKVGNVYAFPGDAVRKGQVLAELETLDDLKEDLETARSEAAASAETERKELRRIEIALEIAQLTLDLARRGGSAEEQRIAELNVELAQMDLDEVQQAIAARLRSDEVQRLETEIAQSVLLAVMDGVLLDEIKAGQNVRADAAVTSIGDPSQLELAALPVIQGDMANLRESMTVSVWLERAPQQHLSGVIRQLPAPYGSGEPSGGLAMAYITLNELPQQAGYTLNDAMLARAVVADIPNAVWLPPEALRSVAGITFVFIQGPTGPQRVNVTPGIFNREQVQILEGLQPGQVVIAP